MMTAALSEGKTIIEKTITTELEGGNLYVYASDITNYKDCYTSSDGYFDDKNGTTCSFTISDFQSGPPVIKDLDIQYVWLRNDFTMDKYEMKATDIPLDIEWSAGGNSLTWRALRSDNNLNIQLLEFYGSGNVYQPSDDDLIWISISFGE